MVTQLAGLMRLSGPMRLSGVDVVDPGSIRFTEAFTANSPEFASLKRILLAWLPGVRGLWLM